MCCAPDIVPRPRSHHHRSTKKTVVASGDHAAHPVPIPNPNTNTDADPDPDPCMLGREHEGGAREGIIRGPRV